MQCGEQEISGFILHWRGEWRAYHNACPHTGVTLNWADDQFFDLDKAYVQCSLHGALFQPLDGLCVYGPCHGQSLTPLAIRLTGDKIILSDAS
ncbi:MAG: Rieske 2Fe-2S domain-containing protein [Gammaproteobacteria bacterium]|nr:Rieske 2Fe-2S domain-containing protein [Gammaproteobacteria bacterium]